MAGCGSLGPPPTITSVSPSISSQWIPLCEACRSRSFAPNTCLVKSITSSACVTVRYGVRVGYCSIAGFSTVVAMVVLLSSSSLSLRLNSGCGSSRNTAATCSSAARLGAGAPTGAGSARPACSIASIAWSSCSIGSRSGIAILLCCSAAHACAQMFQRAELQLLPRALAALQRARNLADTFLLGKTHHHHAPLLGRQRLHQAKQRRPAFYFLHRGFIGWFGLRRALFARRLFPAIGEQIGRDAQQPRGKRCAAPLVFGQTGERALENFGRNVFRLGALAHPACHVAVYLGEAAFVERAKLARIGLRGGDECALVVVFEDRLASP